MLVVRDCAGYIYDRVDTMKEGLELAENYNESYDEAIFEVTGRHYKTNFYEVAEVEDSTTW